MPPPDEVVRRRRGRPRKGESNARERILAAATDVFGEHGYDASTTRAIATRAGVDPALLHHHFGTKADLFAASIGAPLRPEVYSDRFRRLTVAAGVTRITLHSVRHSLAFWLHSLGVTPADAAALLGHTTEVHLSTYLPESGATGIAAAAAALGRAAGGAL